MPSSMALVECKPEGAVALLGQAREMCSMSDVGSKPARS